MHCLIRFFASLLLLHCDYIIWFTKAALSFKNSFCPHPHLYGYESWVMCKRPKWEFLQRIKGVTFFDKVHSSEIRKSLNTEPLLLRIERSQLRWFDHVSRMPQKRLPKQALFAKLKGKRPVEQQRTCWKDYTEDLGWNRLRPQPS